MIEIEESGLIIICCGKRYSVVNICMTCKKRFPENIIEKRELINNFLRGLDWKKEQDHYKTIGFLKDFF